MQDTSIREIIDVVEGLPVWSWLPPRPLTSREFVCALPDTLPYAYVNIYALTDDDYKPDDTFRLFLLKTPNRYHAVRKGGGDVRWYRSGSDDGDLPIQEAAESLTRQIAEGERPVTVAIWDDSEEKGKSGVATLDYESAPARRYLKSLDNVSKQRTQHTYAAPGTFEGSDGRTQPATTRLRLAVESERETGALSEEVDEVPAALDRAARHTYLMGEEVAPWEELDASDGYVAASQFYVNEYGDSRDVNTVADLPYTSTLENDAEFEVSGGTLAVADEETFGGEAQRTTYVPTRVNVGDIVVRYGGGWKQLRTADPFESVTYDGVQPNALEPEDYEVTETMLQEESGGSATLLNAAVEVPRDQVDFKWQAPTASHAETNNIAGTPTSTTAHYTGEVEAVIDDLTSLYGDEIVDEMFDRETIQSTLNNIETLSEALADVSESVEQSIKNLAPAAKAARKSAESVADGMETSGVVEGMNDALEGVGAAPDIEELTVSEEFKDEIEEIRESARLRREEEYEEEGMPYSIFEDEDDGEYEVVETGVPVREWGNLTDMVEGEFPELSEEEVERVAQELADVARER
jgi:hypothetical protein